MFYDLNVPWTANVVEVERTLAFLAELGYNVVALSHEVSGKLPADLSCPIPDPLPLTVPPKLRVFRRCTLIISDPSQNYRLASLAGNYDLLALRPTNERAFQQACQNTECDIISIDLTQRLDFLLKSKTVGQAVERGVKIEICYSPGIATSDSNARRNLITNATALIRATRGRGLIISSQASTPIGCRAPSDLINLAAVWGLGQERGREAMSTSSRSCLVQSQMKRTSFRGAVDIIYGGEQDLSKNAGNKKRKAGDNTSNTTAVTLPIAPLSKRAQKRQKAMALKQQAPE